MRGERVKVGETRTLTKERGGSEREHGEERVDSTMNEGTFQGGQARRGSLQKVEENMSG